MDLYGTHTVGRKKLFSIPSGLAIAVLGRGAMIRARYPFASSGVLGPKKQPLLIT